MKKGRIAIVGSFCVLVLVCLSGGKGSAKLNGADRQTIIRSYGSLPLSFELNQGQTDSEVKFLSRGSGYTLFLTSTEAVLSLVKSKPDLKGKFARKDSRENFEGKEPRNKNALRMKFIGANPARPVKGVGETAGKSNYLIGNDSTKWRTNVPHYAKVKFEDLYPGIDLLYYGNQGQLEYDFVVKPGADPKLIRLSFEGAENVELDSKGNLVFETTGGKLRMQKPHVFQDRGGLRQEIQSAYVIEKSTVENSHLVGFQLAVYDASRPLIIDPVLAYSTYLGGSGNDVGFATAGIAVDAAGNAYVTGNTTSVDFPIVAGAVQGFNAGGTDAFVTKINAAGSGLIYSTYIGGSDFDSAQSIKVDNSGNAFVTGATNSSDFPTTTGAFQTECPGAFQTECPGTGDAFIAKLSPNGSALLYSTYLGGSSNDIGDDIAIDALGNVYVAGVTLSSDFPTTPGAFQASLNGGSAAFVTKLNSTGSALVYSTYLGGTASGASGEGIAIDSAGNAYIAGAANSDGFPVTTGAFQESFAGGPVDAFVSKLNPSGTALVYSTYLGGSGFETAGDIALDASGNTYVTGGTHSVDFPTTAGAFQTTATDPGPFVSKLNPGGTQLVYSTYLGRGGSKSIAIDAAGNAYVVGTTDSTVFPTTPGAIQPSFGGGNIDGFLSKLNPTGSQLIDSTYLGGSDDDSAIDIALDSVGNAFVLGTTMSSNFPTTPGAFQTALAGGFDAFIIRMQMSSEVCTPQPNNLVNWWKGEDNADDSRGTNHGSLANGTAFAAGVVGQAFFFDGVDDEVRVPHHANQNTGSQITVEAWVDPSSFGHGRPILQKRSSSNVGGYTFETTHSPHGPDNGLQFQVWIGGTSHLLQTPANVLSVGNWYHVTAMFDGSMMRIYVNGVEKANMAASGAIDAVTDPLVIGRNVTVSAFAWHGFIDELSIYNRALTATEIQSIFNAGSFGKCTIEAVINGVIDNLQDIIDGNPGTRLADKANDAKAKIEAALNELNQVPPDNQAAVESLKGAIGDLENAVKQSLLDAVLGAQLMDRLAGVARELASGAIDQAIANGGNPTVINKARQALTDGDALRSSGDFKAATNNYKQALARAESA